jgi:AbrB family looped-hinge helix DNA binding protein
VVEQVEQVISIVRPFSTTRYAARSTTKGPKRYAAGGNALIVTPTPHYRGNIFPMAIAHSKLTAQGQISVPARVRRKLGVGPGSVLEWDEDGENVVVRRAGRYSSEDVHRALFRARPAARALSTLKAGVRQHIRKRHAGR